MKQFYSFLLFGIISLSLSAQAPNDECNDRETIVVNTTEALEYTIDTATATETLNASCEFASLDNLDVWYEFTMPVNGNVRVTNIPNTVTISVYDSCGGTELDCFANDGFLYDLDQSTNYIMRLSETSNSAGIVNFRVQAFEEITNNECADRVPIVVNTTDALEYTIDTTRASESLDASCNFATLDNLDAWYEFTMPVNGNVRVTNIPNTVTISIYDSCGGTELDCFTDDGFLYGLDQSINYILRLSETSNAAGIVNFRVQAFEEITNDECADRIPIVVNTTDALEYTIDTNRATETLDASCDFASSNNLDVWYEFTMPVDGNVRVTNIPNTVTISIYDSCGGTELDCFTDDGFLYGLDQSINYIMRLSETSNAAGIVNFRVQAFEEITNDECADRITIAVNTTDALEYTIDTNRATESLNASCDFASFDNLDVWYEFTMPVNGNIRVTNIPNTVTISIYDSCGGTELDCFTNNGFLYGLDQSTNYILRLSETSNAAGLVNFRVQAFEEIANDECANRIPITVTTSEALEYTIDSTRATESLDASCDSASLDNLDAWYEFTMPVSGNLRLTNIANSVGITIYDSCGGNEVSCIYNNGFIYSLDEATTYILRVSESSTSAGIINFRLQAFIAEDNDDCTTPETITVLQETPTTINVSNLGATEGLNATCDFASLDNLDVWYQFTMPVNGSVEISDAANSQGFTLYEDCSGDEIDCFYNDGSFFELINGENYLLRVSTSAGSSGTFDFDIQAIEVAAQPCTDSTIWDGNSWSNGVPDNTKSALFNGNYSTNFDPESINACSCTIASGATVVIGDGFYLRSVFDITVEGSLQVSNAGSVVQVSEDAITINNGSITITKTTPSLMPRDFIVLASPMSQEVNGEVYGAANRVFGIIEDNFVPNTDPELVDVVTNFMDDNGDYLDNLFVDNPSDPDDANGNLSPIDIATGYLVFPQATNATAAVNYSHTYEEGFLNSGLITRATTYNGPNTENNFNLLGNPYASAIDVNQFITANDPVNEVYYWEHITPPDASLPGFNTQNFSMDDVSVYNLTGGIAAVNGGTAPNQFMSSGQGFAILADQAFAGTDVVFNNSMRVVGNNDSLRNQEEENDKLWLQLSTPEYRSTSSTLIGFLPEATAGIDAGYDSKRIPSTISIFSISENGSQLGIQARESFDSAMRIELGVANNYESNLEVSINIQEIMGLELADQDIFLIDKLEGTTTNLKNQEYTFVAEPGTQLDRFLLIFTEDVLDIEEDRFRESNLNLYPNPASNQVTVQYGGSQQLQELTIIDVHGRVVERINMTNFNQEMRVDIQSLATGIYFVQVYGTENTLTKKLIIN